MPCPYYRDGRCIYVPGHAWYNLGREHIKRFMGFDTDLRGLVESACAGEGYRRCRIFIAARACSWLQETQRRIFEEFKGVEVGW